ncbi:magnesium transporter [Campylobacterota bacterium]
MQNENLTSSELTDHLAQLTSAKNESDEAFVLSFLALNGSERANVITELPDTYQKELCRKLSDEQLASFVNLMRTDDATDLMIILKEIDEAKWLKTIELLDTTLTKAVKTLMDYSEEEAGSLMEIEIFTATKHETIHNSMKRLSRLIDNHSLEHIHNVFLVDKEYHLLAIFPLSTIVTVDDQLTYADIYDGASQPLSVHSRASVHEAARLMKRYDLHVLPVINRNGRLLGRITHDDILDHIEENATKQMYGLSQVHPEEEIETGVVETGRNRALWLIINLFNATLVSIVIGFFEHSLQKVVALAVLMPIVANMAGTASMQTLTVIVRQMALGNVSWGDASPTLFKEFKLAFINGMLFATLGTIISYVWFSSWHLGGVMAASMFVSFIFAGILGAYVPLGLKAIKIDPAIASSVIVLTLVDVIGFFSFLWFATMWIPELNT